MVCVLRSAKMELREQLYEAGKLNDDDEEEAAEIDETGRFSR